VRARWALGRGNGITVVAAAAGHFKTEALQKYPEAIREGAARTVPPQRLGRPEEHAWLVALVGSPLGRALSASTVTLGGARDHWFGLWPPPNPRAIRARCRSSNGCRARNAARAPLDSPPHAGVV
jgi:citronellol/citronellal dehydrogenase